MALSRAPVNPAMVPHFMRMDRMTAVPSEVSMARPPRSMCILHAMCHEGAKIAFARYLESACIPPWRGKLRWERDVPQSASCRPTFPYICSCQRPPPASSVRHPSR